jgi:electron transfer flavoprotein alpha subunit
LANDVLVFIEIRGGQVKRPSLEALSEGSRTAKALGGKLMALAVGAGFGSQLEAIAAPGLERILVADDDRAALYQPEIYATLLAEAVRKTGCGIVFLSATALGKDLGPRAAAKLEAGLAADCTQVEVDGGRIKVKRPVYSGKAIATVVFEGSPIFVTLRPNVFRLEEASSGKAPVEKIEIPGAEPRVRTVKAEASEGAELDVSEASIVVSGGRAMKGPENFALIRDLAKALGGAMGASRAAVDAGWIDHQYQVGQTGKVVSPNLYVACGISGAIQHIAGMSSSKVIVAINKDPEAPIFKLADYGIVGDLYEILPRLSEEVRKLKGQS